jgi:adenylate cyclase
MTTRGRPALFIAVGLVGSLIALILYSTHLMRGVEFDSMDARFSLRGDQDPPDDIALVLIDDKTLDELKVRFPYPRSFHGRVINALRKDETAQIAYDIQFVEPTVPSEDNALLDAVSKAGIVVLAAEKVDDQGRSNVFGGEDVVEANRARTGNTQIPESAGGVLRRVPYEVDRLKSFAVVTTEEVTGEPVELSSMPGGSGWIDYYGGPGTIPAYSFSDVMRGKVPEGTFRGKTVVVGAGATDLQDVHATPTGDVSMAGPEIQANAIETVRRGLPLKSAPAGVDVLLILLLGMVAPLAHLRWPPLRAFLIALGAAALYAVVVQLAFNSGLILPVVYPFVAFALSAVAALGAQYILAAVDRQRARDTFSRFVPAPVVDELLARGEGDLRLGSERRTVTVLFSDIRGFTTFSEQRPPEEVIEILNHYLDEMSNAILDAGGTLVSYIGDGIMAVFGAPIEQDDHADRALRAAREMLGPRLERFNAWMSERGQPEGFRMGVGLNTGPVMVGQVGGAARVDYTAIGDTVNTAARLEGMTKGTEHQLFVAESTRSSLRDGEADLVFVEELPVRGREHGIKVWSTPG